MDDVIRDFYKTTPFRLEFKIKDFTPYNLVLEEPCPYGNNCFYKKNPLICNKNHQTNATIILEYSQIPNYICKYERPWIILPNGKEMRCQNKYCWFSHLKGHYEIISKTTG